MPTKYIENTTRESIFVGGKLIAPGDGRDIDISLLPPEHHDAPVAELPPGAPDLAALVAELRAKPVKEIVAGLESLTQEGLELLTQAEKEAEKPRTSLLAALQAEALRRADVAMTAQLQADADNLTAEQLAALTDEQRAALKGVVDGA